MDVSRATHLKEPADAHVVVVDLPALKGRHGEAHEGVLWRGVRACDK